MAMSDRPLQQSRNILTIRWIAMTLCADIHGAPDGSPDPSSSATMGLIFVALSEITQTTVRWIAKI